MKLENENLNESETPKLSIDAVSGCLYAFLYNCCIHESSWATVSLHYSKEGAEKAMQEHKQKALDEFNEMLMEQQNNIEWGKTFPNDFDERISKSIKLREKYNDIIPITKKEQQDALDYLNALSVEDYETCNNFIIE